MSQHWFDVCSLVQLSVSCHFIIFSLFFSLISHFLCVCCCTCTGSENNSLYLYYKGLSKTLLTFKFDTVKSVLDKDKKEDDTNEFVSAVCWRALPDGVSSPHRCSLSSCPWWEKQCVSLLTTPLFSRSPMCSLQQTVKEQSRFVFSIMHIFNMDRIFVVKWVRRVSQCHLWTLLPNKSALFQLQKEVGATFTTGLFIPIILCTPLSLYRYSRWSKSEKVCMSLQRSTQF